MPSARENVNQFLSFADIKVQDAILRAFYDKNDALVFVLDFYTSPIKPNVLLVMNPVDGRKWDDVLVNDFDVDLETIRPKKDNKYQKLDIEYSGVGVYDALFNALESGVGVDGALKHLEVFRRDVAMRVANERLADADAAAERARETIEKASQTIDELYEKQKTLRAKLVTQRRQVGKEPTKQSAAKILRTESQIDATSDKIERTRKRIDSAQRRLTIAEDDADVARGVLELLRNSDDGGVDVVSNEIALNKSKIDFAPVFDDEAVDLDDAHESNLPAAPAQTDVAVVETPSVPMIDTPKFTEITTFKDNTQKPKANNMADEDVKPLFDKDPDIIDEENAFKPIDFNAPTNVPVTSDDNLPVATSDELPVPVEPSANFVPPVSFEPVATDVVPATESAPVLDSITSVSAPVEQIDSELLAGFDNPGATPVPAAPVVPQYANDAPVAEAQPAQPMPEVTPAPDYAPVRPVSPVTGAAAPVVPSDVPQRKPTTMYYLLLVILIVLSVFTLWMYQGSTTDNLPELGASSQPTVADEEKSQESLMDGTAFIDVDQTETVKEQVKVAEPVAKPVVPPTPVAEPEVVAPTPVVESVIVPDVVPDVVTVTESPVVVPDVESQAVQVTPQVVEDTVVEDGTPFLTQETVQPAKTKPIAEIIASKPVYNVSQQEKMFVADSEYETDEVPDVADVVVNTVESDVSSMPTVEYSQPTVVSKPVMPSQPVVTEPVMEYQEPMAVTQQEYFEEEVVDACADGSAPDKNGCCPGENYVNVVGAGYACCVESTGECFPPMK